MNRRQQCPLPDLVDPIKIDPGKKLEKYVIDGSKLDPFMYHLILKRQETPDSQLVIQLNRNFQVSNVRKPGTDEAMNATIGSLIVCRRIRQLYDTTPDELGSTCRFSIPDHEFHYHIYFSCYTLEPEGSPLDSCPGDSRRIIASNQYTLSFEDADVPMPDEYKGKAIRVVAKDDQVLLYKKIYICAGDYPHNTDGNIILHSHYDVYNNPGYVSLKNSKRTCKLFYDKVLDKLNGFVFQVINEDRKVYYWYGNEI